MLFSMQFASCTGREAFVELQSSSYSSSSSSSTVEASEYARCAHRQGTIDMNLANVASIRGRRRRRVRGRLGECVSLKGPLKENKHRLCSTNLYEEDACGAPAPAGLVVGSML